MAYPVAENVTVLRYRFGEFEIDIMERQLTRHAAPITLQPRAFDLLAYMVSRAGRLLSKQTLLDEVWTGTFVTENSLTQCVRQLRAALGDDVSAPTYIATVPRVGYRFVAGVTAERPTAPSRLGPVSPPQRIASDLAAAAALLDDDPHLSAIEQRLNAARRGEIRALYVQGEAGTGDATLIERYRTLLSAFFDALASDTWVTVAVIEEPRQRHCGPTSERAVG